MNELMSLFAFITISIIVIIILLFFSGKKIGPILIGSILIFFGVGMVMKARYFSFIDMLVYINEPLGIVMIMIGGVFFLAFLRKKRGKK